MATTSGPTDSSLIAQLFREPYRFEFFQAVRLLTWSAFEEQARTGRIDPARPVVVGEDSPEREAVRFRAWPSQAFPSSEIASIQNVSRWRVDQSQLAEMTVTFMGLTASHQALPSHY